MTRHDAELPDPFVVAVCYPGVWWAEPGAFDAALAEIAGLRTPSGGTVEAIAAPYEETHERRSARGADPDADWASSQPGIDPDTAAAFARMHAALALDLPADIADRAPGLRFVQAFGAGTDHLTSCRLDEAGVTLVSSAGSNAVGIAEFVMGRVIAHNKGFDEIRSRQSRREWQPVYGREIAGQTMGLIGFGNIAQAVAERARAFGMRVVATRRSATSGDVDERLDAVLPADDLDAMLGECDAVVAAVPNTPETVGLIDETALAAMKPGAFFCNVGRGSLVDEPALIAALESGHLSGAAIDVASREPLPPDDPLWDAPNLAISFHNASVPAAMFANTHRLFLDQLRGLFAAHGGSGPTSDRSWSRDELHER